MLGLHATNKPEGSIPERQNEKLVSGGVAVEFVKDGQTFTGKRDPMATLMLSMMGAIAKFEREMIRGAPAGGDRYRLKRRTIKP